MGTALVIGGTGLVGSSLIDLLIGDSRIGKVISFVRRPSGTAHEKLEEQVVNFDEPATWQHLVKGDILLSTLGTTLKQAGGKDAQYKVDYTYQYEFAEAAAKNQVPSYVLVSSSGANPNSAIFYPRMKGELEREIKKLPFRRISILQPSLITGKRKEKRTGEELGYHVLRGMNSLGLLKKYRPIDGATVARAMIEAGLNQEPGVHTYALDELFLPGRF